MANQEVRQVGNGINVCTLYIFYFQNEISIHNS